MAPRAARGKSQTFADRKLRISKYSLGPVFEPPTCFGGHLSQRVINMEGEEAGLGLGKHRVVQFD